MTLKLVYFAWVRERIGRGEETVTPPAGVETVGDLVRWLATRGPEYEHALANPATLRAAIDQRHVRHDAPLAGAREVALFPPVTGG